MFVITKRSWLCYYLLQSTNIWTKQYSSVDSDMQTITANVILVRMSDGHHNHITAEILIEQGKNNLQGRSASCAWLALISDADIV